MLTSGLNRLDRLLVHPSLWDYTYPIRKLLNFRFFARIMMRDYKIRQTDWPRRRSRRRELRLAALAVAVIALLLLLYVIVRWLVADPASDQSDAPAEQSEQSQPPKANPRIIPLAIPPAKPMPVSPTEGATSGTPRG